MIEPTEWDCDNCGTLNIAYPDESAPMCFNCGLEEDWDIIMGTQFSDGVGSWHDDPMYHSYDDDYKIDGVGFADPGGESALRAATPTNPRNLPCPTCGEENVLTPLDVRAGYQCDRCANAAERGWEY